jgi:thymidylate synthase ThyX
MANPPAPAATDAAPKNESTQNEATKQPSTNVFAVHGADPEVQAYAMAKYSRSALSMKESLKELNEQKAEQFLNTFYFQYGHRSIADLAHIAFAIEKLSLLAAISLVDEQRWDGQERSTRYQNFKKSGFYTPDFAGDQASEDLYNETCRFLFTEYEIFSEGMFRHLEERTPKPADMDQGQYDRTLKARAFDISRYLLPLATNTSLGQIVNARTLETQISRLLTSNYGEIRNLGELLKQASREPSFNVTHARLSEVLEKIRTISPELAEQVRPELLREVRVSPTLVKYATMNDYERKTRAELRFAARELMKDAPLQKARVVELLDDDPLEIELATTLLYAHCHYSYRQVRDSVSALTEAQRREIIDLGLRHRGKHDELPRPFCAGQKFRFDILMDVGGFRDMHRHRRCIQIEQGYTSAHGFDEPEELQKAAMSQRYHDNMRRAAAAAAKIAEGGPYQGAASAASSGSGVSPKSQRAYQDAALATPPPTNKGESPFRGGTYESPAEDARAEAALANSHYLLPLAYRKRCLFNMDFAEALYIAELRTTEAGHWSYRKVAHEMFLAVAAKYPALAKYFRVTDVTKPVDLLKR